MARAVALSSVLALAGPIAMLPATALATTLSLTNGFSATASTNASGVGGSGSDSDTDTLTFAQFDPSLGTLNSIEFRLEDVTATTSSSLSISGAEGVSASARSSSTFSIKAPGGAPPTITLFEGTGTADTACSKNSGGISSCTAGPPGTVTPPSFAASALIDQPADLVPYIGPGNVDIDAIVDLLASMQSCSFTGARTSSTSCSTTGEASWSGTLRLTYDYTAPTEPGGGDVPEPASLLLLGAGLAGLGATRRSQGGRAERRRDLAPPT